MLYRIQEHSFFFSTLKNTVGNENVDGGRGQLLPTLHLRKTEKPTVHTNTMELSMIIFVATVSFLECWLRSKGSRSPRSSPKLPFNQSTKRSITYRRTAPARPKVRICARRTSLSCRRKRSSTRWSATSPSSHWVRCWEDEPPFDPRDTIVEPL